MLCFMIIHFLVLFSFCFDVVISVGFQIEDGFRGCLKRNWFMCVCVCVVCGEGGWFLNDGDDGF